MFTFTNMKSISQNLSMLPGDNLTVNNTATVNNTGDRSSDDRAADYARLDRSEEELADDAPDRIEAPIHQPILKVLGLGGGGCNAVERMIELGLKGVEFIVANTDIQALEKNSAQRKIQLGPNCTRGLGAGGDPRVGEAAVKESAKEIAEALSGADMVFLTAGMGGGTGTGSIAAAAEIAQQVGAVTIAIVTTPFSFEMGRRQRNASEGLTKLQSKTNTLIAIPNDRLLYVAPRDLPMETAFRLADDVLRQAVQGITELITEPGLINVDFAHIRRMIQLGGGALMSIGQAKGENKALRALDQALHHPILDSISLDNAAGIIVNFTGGSDLSLLEVQEALTLLQHQAGAETEIILGVTNDERMGDRVQIILVITGLGAPSLEETLSGLKKTGPRSTEVVGEKVVEKAEKADWRVAPQEIYASPSFDTTTAAHNLDLPAFLRRRSR